MGFRLQVDDESRCDPKSTYQLGFSSTHSSGQGNTESRTRGTFWSTQWVLPFGQVQFARAITEAGLLTFGALWVALSALIQEVWQYTVIRFFIGFVGATFVTNQFWCSLMFSQSIVGTANATAAGWGNLGGGVTQIFMISVLFDPMVNSGLTADTAWRVSMTIPAILFLLCAAALKLLCWDMPTAKHIDVATIGKTRQPSLWDYVEVLKDVRVLVMIFQYSACFGAELATWT